MQNLISNSDDAHLVNEFLLMPSFQACLSSSRNYNKAKHRSTRSIWSNLLKATVPKGSRDPWCKFPWYSDISDKLSEYLTGNGAFTSWLGRNVVCSLFGDPNVSGLAPSSLSVRPFRFLCVMYTQVCSFTFSRQGIYRHNQLSNIFLLEYHTHFWIMRFYHRSNKLKSTPNYPAREISANLLLFTLWPKY